MTLLRLIGCLFHQSDLGIAVWCHHQKLTSTGSFHFCFAFLFSFLLLFSFAGLFVCLFLRWERTNNIDANLLDRLAGKRVESPEQRQRGRSESPGSKVTKSNKEEQNRNMRTFLMVWWNVLVNRARCSRRISHATMDYSGRLMQINAASAKPLIWFQDGLNKSRGIQSKSMSSGAAIMHLGHFYAGSGRAITSTHVKFLTEQDTARNRCRWFNKEGSLTSTWLSVARFMKEK